MAERLPSISVSESTLKKGVLLLCVLFFWVMGNAQAVKVSFEGNRRTKADFLLKVMKMDTLHFDEYELEMGIQRLRNLPILVSVTAEVSTDKNPVEVHLTIEEGVVIWPLVSFGGVEENRWFLLGASDFNTGGRAIQTTAFYRNIDGEHNGFFSIAAPYIKGTSFGGGIEIQRYAAIEPLFFEPEVQGVDYRYENLTLGAHIAYAFDYQHRLLFGLSYLKEEYTSLEQQDPLSSFNFPQLASKEKYLFKLIHDLNRINFHGFERAGWSFNQQFQLINDIGATANPFMMYWMEGRWFRRFANMPLNIAVRGRIGFSSNEINPFAPFVLDSQLNIRGAGNRVERGTGVAVLNTELRFALLETKSIVLQGVAFSDLGNWRKPGGVVNDLLCAENLEHFVGGGVRLLWKRSQLACLRIDYGISTQNTQQHGVVIGVGQFF